MGSTYCEIETNHRHLLLGLRSEYSVCLSIERLGVRSKATEWIAAALLG